MDSDNNLKYANRLVHEIREHRIVEKVIDLPVAEDGEYEVDEEQNEIKRDSYFIQYSREEGTKYRPSCESVPILPAGFYSILVDNYGLFFNKLTLNISELIRFPNTIADAVITEFEKFWTKKSEYISRGESHKRGFLLWGPPGGGKTSTVSFIIKDFINSGNIIFNFNSNITSGLTYFRKIEPTRKVMIIIEDIDSIIRSREGEAEILQLLDGSIQHNDTIIIATTNYPEDLPDRIINRPSRFDRISYIGLPSEDERLLYLQRKSKKLTEDETKRWVKDTDDYTLAHIKELILAVEVFDLDYNDTLQRLNEMRRKAASSNDYERRMRGKTKSAGFGMDDSVGLIGAQSNTTPTQGQGNVPSKRRY